MKAKSLLRACAYFAINLVASTAGAWAQGPAIDPTFRATTLYKPADIMQMVQQADGKRLMFGSMLRVGNQPTGPLARLQANSNLPDSAFTSNVRGLQAALKLVVALPSGKVLLVGYNELSLGPVSRQQLLLLNADGTPDASFNANIAPSTGYGSNPILNAVGQPDGKLVLVCSNSLSSGTGILVRLLPTGAVDAAFQSELNSSVGVIGRVGTNVVVQADGKLVVPGDFAGRGVIRLLPTGALDPSFTAQLPVSFTFLTNEVAVQSDGKVLVTAVNNQNGNRQPVVRLTASGAVDPTFQPAVIGSFSSNSGWGASLQLQPDGKVLVNTPILTTSAGAPLGSLVRLLPDGTLDNTFAPPASLGSTYIRSSQLLPNGQVLAVKAQVANSAIAESTILLNPDGSQDSRFQPRFYNTGYINEVVQLPGGGYLVGGNFTEINSVPRANLARLSATGTTDATWPAAAGPDAEVRAVLVQPDGKVVVGGYFNNVAGIGRASLARLLPTGMLDATFAPPFVPIVGGYQQPGIERVALLPNGRVLAAGNTQLAGASSSEPWLRSLDATTGQPDLALPHYVANDLLVQPSGKVVVGGFYNASGAASGVGFCVFRLLASGGPDPSFAATFTIIGGLGGGPVISALAQNAAGNLYFTGHFYIDAGPPAPARLYVTQPDGQPTAEVPDSRFGAVASIAVQPNGRVLLGNRFTSPGQIYGLRRVLNNAFTDDPTFNSASGPLEAVRRVLVQPDGAIMAAGAFTHVGSQAITGLVRLLDASVLGVASRPLDARTQAWPVPAHGQLHLQLDAASRPQRVELLDALGRVVLAQAASQTEVTLDTSALAAGTYVLRVQYADGPVARRIAVE
jgi:uncharacterized delta-60 repeat protein